MGNSVDVIIIGGGWSGLVACKHMLEADFSVALFEKREEIGGIWGYSDDPAIITAMKNTVTSSSSTVTEISDFPMPPDFGHFPHHTKIKKYLESYCSKFNLGPHIKTNTEISQVKKEGERWVVSTASGETYSSKYLCVCTGTHRVPNDEIMHTVFAPFKGKIIHSIEYKRPLPEHIGKKILVYGGGETASDIATELSYVADKVYCSIPHGQWFQRKKGTDSEIFDHYSSRLRVWCCPPDLGCPLIVRVLTYYYGFQQHGIEEWRSPAPYYGQFFNKSPAILDRVKDGFVIPLPGVKTVNAENIEFTNGKEFDVDYVILSTGYHPVFDFLPKEYAHNPNDRLKLIFDPKDPTLAFLGLIRPTVTSIPFMTETQVRCAVNVFKGVVKIPSQEEIQSIMDKDNAYLKNRFSMTSGNIRGLVDPMWYIETVSRFGKFYPNYWKLFFQNPLFWWLCITTPVHSSMFLVHDRKYRPYLKNLYRNLRARPPLKRLFLDTFGGWIFFRAIEACMRFYRKIRA